MKLSLFLFSKRRIHKNYYGKMPSKSDKSNVRYRLVIKKISGRNPIHATSIPIKKLSELGAAKDNNNDESPIKFMG